MKKENNENEKSLKTVKEKFSTKFFRKIKKKWLITSTNTLLLIAIIFAIFILINILVKKADFTPIDCSTSKDYTLTDESKERVSKIEKDVNIYFVGWDESNKDYELAKQYHKVNSKINVEIVDATENLELAKKYDVTNEDMAVIIESGETYRKLYYYSDIVSYDSSYKSVDLAEQKITSAILNVTSGKIAKVYYLTGYTSYSFGRGLSSFSKYLNDEVLTYEELNLLNTQTVPEDCDTLIIMTPEKDFDKTVADAIINYIKKGGNILWLNGAYAEKMELTNANMVLAEFGIKDFDVGIVYETNQKNTILGYSACFLPEIEETDATRDVYKSAGVTFLYATKINVDTDRLGELNVEEKKLIHSSNTTYFTSDLTGAASQNDEKGEYVLGVEMDKKIDDNTTSKLILYGNDLFVTDYAITDGAGNNSYMIYLYNNADLALNSIAYLTNNDQDLTIRKNYSDSETKFTATDAQKSLIMKVIFIVPAIIIVIGIIIWIRRRNRQ